MWSNGVPSSSGTANDDACITVAGTYTVFLNASTATVNSIQIDGSSGTQTLALQTTHDCGVGGAAATLTTATGIIGTHGQITLTSAGNCPTFVPSTLAVSSGTLSNSGTILSVVGPIGGERVLQGNITNTSGGTIDIDTKHVLQRGLEDVAEPGDSGSGDGKVSYVAGVGSRPPARVDDMLARQKLRVSD